VGIEKQASMSIHLSSSETVIHLNRVPAGVCFGKDHAAAEVEEFIRTPHDKPASFSTALADFSGNVTCERCLSWLRSNKSRRKQMSVAA